MANVKGRGVRVEIGSVEGSHLILKVTTDANGKTTVHSVDQQDILSGKPASMARALWDRRNAMQHKQFYPTLEKQEF